MAAKEWDILNLLRQSPNSRDSIRKLRAFLYLPRLPDTIHIDALKPTRGQLEDAAYTFNLLQILDNKENTLSNQELETKGILAFVVDASTDTLRSDKATLWFKDTLEKSEKQREISTVVRKLRQSRRDRAADVRDLKDDVRVSRARQDEQRVNFERMLENVRSSRGVADANLIARNERLARKIKENLDGQINEATRKLVDDNEQLTDQLTETASLIDDLNERTRQLGEERDEQDQHINRLNARVQIYEGAETEQEETNRDLAGQLADSHLKIRELEEELTKTQQSGEQQEIQALRDENVALKAELDIGLPPGNARAISATNRRLRIKNKGLEAANKVQEEIIERERANYQKGDLVKTQIELLRANRAYEALRITSVDSTKKLIGIIREAREKADKAEKAKAKASEKSLLRETGLRRKIKQLKEDTADERTEEEEEVVEEEEEVPWVG